MERRENGSQADTSGAEAAQANLIAARTLSGDVGAVLRISTRNAFDALCTVPENLLVLLESPEGWAVLASYIANDLRISRAGYWPTVH